MSRVRDRFGHKCLDCGKLQYPSRVELIRARSPRCLWCGGPLEPCKSAVKKIATAADAKRESVATVNQKMGKK